MTLAKIALTATQPASRPWLVLAMNVNGVTGKQTIIMITAKNCAISRVIVTNRVASPIPAKSMIPEPPRSAKEMRESRNPGDLIDYTCYDSTLRISQSKFAGSIAAKAQHDQIATTPRNAVPIGHEQNWRHFTTGFTERPFHLSIKAVFMNRNSKQVLTAFSIFFVGLITAAARADDSEKLRTILNKAADTGGVITIPPGDYELDGKTPLPLTSGMTINAQGARFHFPKTLSDRARIVLFVGENIQDFQWFGGHFDGEVFDPSREHNTWEPNVNTRAILITTKPGGLTQNLTFRDITSHGLAGAAVTVMGAEKKGSESEIDTPARNVTVDNCTLLRTGKFMWDYGYLWQISVWPEEYNDRERAMAAKYFRNDLVRGPLRMEENDDRVWFDNTKPLPVTKKREGVDATRGHEAICFLGDALPKNLIRGKQYAVVESNPQYIRIANAPGEPPIRFVGGCGPNAKLISDLYLAHLALYAPTGSGPGKGAIDLVGCENVIVRGCRLSALGDTMHIQKSRGIVFAGNQITGSRMGAFFIAEFCADAVVTGNTVDGTNGSRIMSVEKSSRDVTIVGNTFRNGGRGSWINQPRNFVLADNIFVNNTTKCEKTPRRGRRSFIDGDYEHYSELYFTTYEPQGHYGNITVRGNIFTSGPNAEHAIRFNAGGDTIIVTDNIFAGPVRDIAQAPGTENITIRDNQQSTAKPTTGR